MDEEKLEWNGKMAQKTWEPDHCFDGKMLDEINRKFTKIGTRRKTCLNK